MSRVIPFSAGGRGHGPRMVVVRNGELEEAWLEAAAVAGEAERFASRVLLAAHGIQSAIAMGREVLAGSLAAHLEREATKAQHRAMVARVGAALAQQRCPGDEEAGPIHGGRAA